MFESEWKNSPTVEMENMRRRTITALIIMNEMMDDEEEEFKIT